MDYYNLVVNIVLAVIALASFVMSIISCVKTSSYSKKEKQDREREMITNYHSYPLITNQKECGLTIPTDSICVISGCIENTNVLALESKVLRDDYYIDICLCFSNNSSILPNEVLINKLDIFFDSEQFGNEKVLKESLFLNNIDNKYKTVFIDGNKDIRFVTKCIINKEISEKIINALDKDEIIQLSFTYSFKTIFGVYTDGEYNTCIKKISTSKKGSEKIIGSNKILYEFITEKSQNRIKKIYYMKEKNKSRN